MNPITLPTSPETRAALEKAGWCFVRSARQDPQPELWMRGVLCDVTITSDGRMRSTGDLFYAAEFVAIYGAPVPGYRIIPEDVAAVIYEKLNTELHLLPLDAPFRRRDLTWMRDAIAPNQAPPQPRPAGDGGLSPSPLALLKSLYACAVNSAKVEPELERQIRMAIGEDAASVPALHPDAQAMLNTVQNYLESYDTDRMARKLRKFMEGAGEGAEPREEETP